MIERLKQLSYLVKARPYPLEKPIVLQFPVIDICNSQCQMCRIWENKKSDDITSDNLRKGLRNPLFSEVRGVGLNGGEPTLRKDLAALATVLFEELPSLRNIALITNAYKYQEVIERITEVGEVVSKHHGTMDVMVSLDGYGEVHDRVRGKPGNFERAQHVIDFITHSPLVHSVRIGCTIIKENVYGLHDLFDYCQSRGLYIKYRLGIPHQRLYTQNLLDPYALTLEEKYHVAVFMEGLIAHYETNENQKFFYRSLADQLVLNAPRKAGCDWQHRGATITSKGELLYCAVQSKVLGSIVKDDSEAIYFGNEAHIKDIIATKCDTCNHDYVGQPPRNVLAMHFAKRLIKRTGTESWVAKLRSGSIGRLSAKQRFESHRIDFMQKGKEPSKHQLPHFTGKRVLICGWYGTETLGDKAIIGGVMEAIRTVMEPVEFIVVALFPYVTKITQGQMPEFKNTRVVCPEDGVRFAKAMDLVVFGGGPLMGLNDLAEMEAIFATARDHQVPTFIAGCGVGPFGEAWHNASLRRLLDLADLRIYRDQQSLCNAASLGVQTEHDLVAEDPAFSWLQSNRSRLVSRPQRDRKVLLLGLRDFPYAQYARHLNKAECLTAKACYEREILVALEQLTANHSGMVIRPLPMCTNHFGDDDRWFYRRLFRGNSTLQERLDFSLLGRELPPLDYCEAFRGADVAITMRFHSLVFALGLELPTIAIDYTLGKGKVHALAERFDVPYQSLAELDANFLATTVERLLANPVPQGIDFQPQFSALVCEHLPMLLAR